MGERLFPNIRKITTVFCLSIIFITIGLFALRLTALSDMVQANGGGGPRLHEVEIAGTPFVYRVVDSLEFESPSARSMSRSALAENAEENDFYMRLEIIYDITGRSIYLSPFLSPGASISSGYLQGVPLVQGEHRGTAVITVYDPATRRQLGSRSHSIMIEIGES